MLGITSKSNPRLQKYVFENYTLMPEDDGYTIFFVGGNQEEPGVVTLGHPEVIRYPESYEVSIIMIGPGRFNDFANVVIPAGRIGWSVHHENPVEVGENIKISAGSKIKLTRILNERSIYVENPVPEPVSEQTKCVYTFTHEIFKPVGAQKWIIRLWTVEGEIPIAPYETFYNVRLVFFDSSYEDVVMNTATYEAEIQRENFEIVGVTILAGSQIFVPSIVHTFEMDAHASAMRIAINSSGKHYGFDHEFKDECNLLQQQ